MELLYLPGVRAELSELPPAERKAMINALDKLSMLGADLGYPHTSQVKGTTLRELRPRAGRSPWRAFYQRHRDVVLIAAIGPEAHHDPRRFGHTIATARDRLEQLETGRCLR